VGFGTIENVSKAEVIVAVERVVDVPRPIALEVVVPIADKERMLLAAEKCVELQVTAWRPTYFARSRSVSPRGEGVKFHEKVSARMQSALEQSGGAWLPHVHADADACDVLTRVPSQLRRFLLDQNGSALLSHDLSVGAAIAIGPEGGLEPAEVAAATDCGWVAVSLTTTTLRFETAVIVGAALVRATQLSTRGS
jgi:16S rRNA (uracil1498-N3)-methyltransferase